MQHPSGGGTCGDQEQRHLVVIPPKNISIGNTYAIHGIVLDDSVHVAPQGCTVLHLTTMVDVKENDDSDNASILQKACEMVLKGDQSGRVVDELYHVSFCHDFVSSNGTGTEELSQPTGLHVCHRSGLALAADTAFEQAQEIFSNICPGNKFLALSKELDTVVKELAADRGEDDDERVMLDRAVGMIEGTTMTPAAEPSSLDPQDE
jgi:hypothetical protein